MLQVYFDGDRYVARLSLDQKETVRRAGFLWDNDAKRWVTNESSVAYRLLEFTEPQTRQLIFKDLDLHFDTQPKELKWPARVKPFLHQLEAARFVLSRRASYLAMEAGTGKTPILPICINTDPGPAIVVCPSFLKYNWEDELERWLIEFKKIQLIKGQRDILDPEADIYILPDSLIGLHLIRDQFFKLGRIFKYQFTDEAHRFKSLKARRTQSLVGGKSSVGNTKVQWKGFHTISQHVVNLSGTPMPNRPLELYPLISKQAPHAINYLDMHRFGVRYCAGFESEWGWDYSGASNLEELNQILSRNYMFVKNIDDCIDLPTKLPPRFLFLEDDRGTKIKQEEMRLLENIKLDEIIRLESIHNEAFRLRVKEKKERAVQESRSTSNIGFEFMSELRKMMGIKKVVQAVDIIKQLLEENEKLVVFCWHEEVSAELCKRLYEYRPFKIVGSTPHERRHAYVREFQSGPTRLMVCNIQAAGVGITLTKAYTALFVEPSWVPADNDQAIARLRRIGQEMPVQPYFLVWKNSLDHRILNAHQEKTINIQTVIQPRG